MSPEDFLRDAGWRPSPGSEGDTWLDPTDGYPFGRDKAVRAQVEREATRLSFVLARCRVEIEAPTTWTQDAAKFEAVQITITPKD